MALALLQRGSESRNLVEFLVQGALVVFFIVLPLVRALRQAAVKRREARERGEQPEAEQQQEQRRAAEIWETLLRGEEPAAAPSSAPPAQAQPEPRAAPQWVEPERAPLTLSKLPEPIGAKPLPGAASAGHASEDEEGSAREEIDRRLEDERDWRARKLHEERALVLERRARGAPLAEGSAAHESLSARRGRARQARHGRLLELASREDRRGALARALVAVEVFGRPVALRPPGEGASPLGLRD